MSEAKKPTQTTSDWERKAPSVPSQMMNDSAQAGSTVEHDANAEDLSFLAPPQSPDEIGRLNGYRILRKLGEGGMGLVFEAEDIDLNRRVALKVMRPEVATHRASRARFLREAKAAAAVEHAHIVPIFRIGEENGVPFIAMPFLKGEPLDARLKRSRLQLDEILAIGWQTASGLAAAHERGMIHRDVKPANVWLSLDTEGHIDVKILDFGLARSAEDDIKITSTGAVIGTPAYMSPEQANAENVDHRADLFSLGAMLYEMATGQRPFKGRSFAAILASLSLDTPAQPLTLNPKLPSALAKLIMKLLEKDPVHRPQSASEVVEVFRQISPDGATRAKPASATVDVGIHTTQRVEKSRAARSATSSTAGAVQTKIQKGSRDWTGKAPSAGNASKTRSTQSSSRWILIGAAVIIVGAGVGYFALKDNKKPTLSSVPEGGSDKVDPKLEQGSKPDPTKFAKVDPSQKDDPKVVAKIDPEKVKPDQKQPVEQEPKKIKDDILTFDLGNNVKLELIKINAKGKSFQMGSPIDEPFRAKPKPFKDFGFDPEFQHNVSFNHDWYMGKFEVTQLQYEAIMGYNPSNSSCKGSNRPVDSVSWKDAEVFINKLNEKFKGRKLKFRLPTEAEWEYACRAGTKTAYFFGETITNDQAHFGDNTTKVASMPVGSFKPNTFGLYDMHGNVQEWCEDVYGDYKDAPNDGKAPTPKPLRQGSTECVLRGGHWSAGEGELRAAHRAHINQATTSSHNGIRVVCEGTVGGMRPDDSPAIEPDPVPAPVVKGDELAFDLGDKIKLEVIKINAKGQKFLMGSPLDEPARVLIPLPGTSPIEERNFDFELQHAVSFNHDWYMGKYEVTQEQYKAIMGTNPSRYEGLKNPVERVSWKEAQEFIKKLNEKLKDRKVTFRLPSEAEWEYACRAGTTTIFYFGKTITTQQAHFDDQLKKVGTKPVGSFKPNALGLYDMLGNVSELCQDYYGPYSKAPKDGKPMTETIRKPPLDDHVIRGGNYSDSAWKCRSAYRSEIRPTSGADSVGLRLVCVPD